MEIRNVVNEVKKEYPKMEHLSKNRLIHSIPNKWLKAGLTSIGISILMKNNVFAASVLNNEFAYNGIDIYGGMGVVENPVQPGNIILSIIQIILIIAFIITGLNILITKIKSKKQTEPKKVKKWVKIIFILSIVILIITAHLHLFF